MVISELALGFLTNLIYDSSKKIPESIFNTYSKVYEKAIEEFSNKNYKLNGIQIDTLFHQKNVEKAIEEYLQNQNKTDCVNILIHEFFELFSEEDFSRRDADLILNTFFEILDAEIEKYPELIIFLDHQLAKQTYQKVQEIHKAINGSRANQEQNESGIDEKLLVEYLNKIIHEDQNIEVSEVYTELSAKEIFPISLKFRDENNNRAKEFEVLELVDKEKKLIISGESGSGKTTTLKWLNFTFATKYLENKDGDIPLHVELNSYIRGSFYDYFKHQIKKKGLPEISLKALLEGSAIILLDGFDLLSSTENFFPNDEISNFISEYSNCKFIVSSRPGFFESIQSDFKVSELEKLTDEKIKIFIEKSVENKELAEVLIDKILDNPKLKSILTNPMMLYLAVNVAVDRQKNNSVDLSATEDLFPQTRTELYEIFVSDLFKQNERNRRLHADRAQIENALTDLFFELQRRNKVSCRYNEGLQIVKKHADDPTFRKISSQEILEDFIKLGLMRRNSSEIGYGIHQSFQEYFAAIKLKELFEIGFDISESFSHPKWEEVVIFTSEMLNIDSVDDFIYSMISKNAIFLASKCITRANDEMKEKLCALLEDKIDSKYELEKINSIESLGRAGTTGISIIAEAVKSQDECVRRIAIDTLENINSDIVAQLPVIMLKDKKGNKDVWNFENFSLEMIKTTETVEKSIRTMHNKDKLISLLGTDVLGIKSRRQ